MAAPLLQPFVRPQEPEVNETFYDAQAAYRYVRAFFNHNARGVKFQKVAGFGASGIVTVWEQCDENLQHKSRSFAVKIPVQIYDPFLRAEMSWMAVTFKSYEHFVQLIELPPHNLAKGRYNDYNALDDESGAIMIMEYFELGTLQDLLCRINESTRGNRRLELYQKKLEFIPHRILWRMFLCRMGYPPPADHDFNTPYGEECPDCSEDGDNWEPPSRILHLDMHPQNIFLEKAVSDPEHGNAPRLKLGDFGVTTEWDDEWTDEQKYESARVGRVGYQAPEQRDNRNYEPEGLGTHTNIWSAGLVMFNMLTMYYTDDPEWQPRECEVRMPHGELFPILTWAPFLVGNLVYPEFQKYNLDLRMLIARCMADSKDDRPVLDELVAIIQDNIRSGDEAAARLQAEWEEELRNNPGSGPPSVDVTQPPEVESDSLLRRWRREYLDEPEKREDLYAALWDEPD
ncbi:kinase-like domain-containing protein [Annulohypoxylon stygium]|nr:kinase-like domain-containing protein [Annulohypoxylon stygium]